MTLLRFEFIKIFRKPYIVISILLFTLIDFAAVFVTSKGYQQWVMEEDQNNVCMEYLCGPIDNEKIDKVINETKRLTDIVNSQKFSREYDPETKTGYIFSDFNLYYGYLEPNLKYAVNYVYVMQDILQRAYENINFYEQVGNTKKMNENHDIIRLYSGRAINEYRNLNGARSLLFYDFSELLIILLLILTLTPGFVSEKENRMEQLFPTFPKGGSQLNYAKFLFIILITAIYCIWFFVMDFIGFAMFSHLQGFSLPLYSIQEFELTPLTVSILQYYGINLILKFFGMLLVAFFISILSKVLPNMVYVFLGSIIPLVLYFVWQPRTHATLSRFEFFNPMLLIRNRYLFLSYNSVFVGSYPIQPVVLAILASTLMLLFSGIVIQAKIRTRAA